MKKLLYAAITAGFLISGWFCPEVLLVPLACILLQTAWLNLHWRGIV